MPPASNSAGMPLIRGTKAYVSQQAWIYNATVRENILFGRKYDETRYANAIKVSALTRDLGLMTDGDMTEIGEKGVNLSGGQKQRVSIARAVYADADVILFDDPLSALDAHVAKEIFDECIRGYLKGKTIVFVTNRLEFVSGCDRVLMVDDGSIVADGTVACCTMSFRSVRFLLLFSFLLDTACLLFYLLLGYGQTFTRYADMCTIAMMLNTHTHARTRIYMHARTRIYMHTHTRARAQTGTVPQLMQSNTLFRELMKDAGSVDAAAAAKTSGSASSSEDGAGVGSSGGTAASSPIRPPSKKGLSLLSSMSPQPQPAPVVSGGVTGGGLNADPKDLKAAPTVQHGLIEKEKRAKGSVGLGLIVDYARASGGISVVATILVTFAAIEAARLGASLWISKWANSEGDVVFSITPE